MRNKGFWILMIINILFFIADITTTLWNGNLVQYLEANPIYKYGGITGIIILNVLLMAYFWWYYHWKKPKPLGRFVMMSAMVSIIVGRIFALRNNIHWIMNPITVEQAQIISTEATKAATMVSISWLMYLPMIVSIIAMWFFSMDHKIERKFEPKWKNR